MHARVNGIAVHYALAGPGEAPVVTLGHSLATSLAMWDPQMEMLTSTYRVLRYDTRGHGGSDAPEGDYTLDLLADDLLALLDALDIAATHYVGLSMGGMIGQTAVLRDPARFLSLALCDTASRIPPEAPPVWAGRIRTARQRGMQALVEPTIDRWFSPAYRASAVLEVDRVREMIRATPVAGYCGCSHAISRLDLTDRLAAIGLPTLLIVGEDDPGTPIAAHEAIKAQIAGAELVVIPQAMHLSNIEQRDAFNAALGTFLSRVAR
jgi:3-oxoadipate enol-lactonase